MTKHSVGESCFGEDHMLVHTMVVDQIISKNDCGTGDTEVERPPVLLAHYGA